MKQGREIKPGKMSKVMMSITSVQFHRALHIMGVDLHY